MTQTILDALRGIADLQRTLEITDPVPTSILTVFYLPPDRNNPLDYPCWFNTWTFTGFNRKTTNLLQQMYTIHSEFWVYDPNTDRAAEIATAFHNAYVLALNLNITLSGAVDTSTLRGGDPTLVLSEWNGVPYAGLDLFLDVTLSHGMTFS